MIDRRTLLTTSAAGLLASGIPSRAFAAATEDPVAIYARAAKGKGDGGGAFIIETRAAKAKYL
jgi:hypothetical protein